MKKELKKFVLTKIWTPILSASVFWLTLIWVVYAASITSTTQTVNSWDAITASWYQEVNNKLQNVYNKTEIDTNNYTKTEIDSLLATLESKLTDWRDQDTNCSLPDVQIWDQVWAGCNSTLWTGIDYVPWHCYNYAWTNNGSNCGWSTTIESDYSSQHTTNWVNNIWWKLYTWDNAQNACGTWYHLPSIEEWTQAMINLGCTDTVSSTTTWWQCPWLWWKNNGILKDKLKLPLAGYRNTDGVSFHYRGNNTGLWASSVSGSNGRWVRLNRNLDTLNRYSRNKSYGFSVRCIKD